MTLSIFAGLAEQIIMTLSSAAVLRVAVQLVDAKQGYQLWSGQYDRRIEDTLELQTDIAHGEVKSLKKSCEAY